MKNYTAAEVAARLGLTPQRVNQIAAALGLGTRGTSNGRPRLFSRDDIRAMRDRNTKPGPRTQKTPKEKS